MKRSLEMHQLFLSPLLKIKVLLKMLILQDKSKNLLNCQYYNISELNNMILNHNKKFSSFHLNISSLPYRFQALSNLLKSLKNNFSITGITESRVKVNSKPLINMSLSNYNIESTPTESEKGGTLLHISSDLNYKVRNDLKIYKAKELESVFIEIINRDKKNYIVVCTYKHPNMLTHEFNDILIPILETICLENEEGYVMRYFNINLMNYEIDLPTSHFLDNFCSNSFFPYIMYPERHLSRSKTLIDNLLHNGINGNTVSFVQDNFKHDLQSID